jgi:Ca2+/Na+ antiporter
MIKNWLHDFTLAIQARSGVTSGLFIWIAVIAVASVTAFAFLCVAAYAWLAWELGNVIAGLVLAGVFIVIAVIGGVVCTSARRRARERAILERAARAHASSSWLLDPKILGVAVQAGRAVGWQRIVPIALLGFMAAQLAREHRARQSDDTA